MKMRTIGMRVYQANHGITTDHYSATIKLVFGSLLGAIAALLQAAGLFSGIGYVLSMLATGPIIIATIMSIRVGLLTYVLTALLLLVIQPTEVLVFLFTTGILGIGLGTGFKVLKRKLFVTAAGALTLAMGIASLLYLFQFPILGSSLTGQLNMSVTAGILAFCLLYSWIWMRVSLFAMHRFEKQYSVRRSDG
jgi:hypothetical protein